MPTCCQDTTCKYIRGLLAITIRLTALWRTLRRWLLGLRPGRRAKDIALAVPGADVGGVRRVILELLPQVAHIDGQIGPLPRVPLPPDLGEERVVGDDGVAVADQATQQLELLGAQGDEAPVPGHALAFEVDLQHGVAAIAIALAVVDGCARREPGDTGSTLGG